MILKETKDEVQLIENPLVPGKPVEITGEGDREKDEVSNVDDAEGIAGQADAR